MYAKLKQIYSLDKNGTDISFVRRGVEYSIALQDVKLRDAVPYLQTRLSLSHVGELTDTTINQLELLQNELNQESLLRNEDSSAKCESGQELYAFFREILPDWMREAFSSEYWNIMLSGKGSKQLYIGYLLELYHYTKNANRHMPLVVANCPGELKSVKKLLAMHYFEEWNHYDFFSDALLAMGIPKHEVESSEPLPSTLKMSNFMRQAARAGTLPYAICSAILEGTTEDSGSYGEYFRKIASLYNIPDEAIQPLFDHLALDAHYDHKSLFEDVCKEFSVISKRDAEEALFFGRQMIDHIYLWTEHIHQYYGGKDYSGVRRKFDLVRD